MKRIVLMTRVHHLTGQPSLQCSGQCNREHCSVGVLKDMSLASRLLLDDVVDSLVRGVADDAVDSVVVRSVVDDVVDSVVHSVLDDVLDSAAVIVAVVSGAQSKYYAHYSSLLIPRTPLWTKFYMEP